MVHWKIKDQECEKCDFKCSKKSALTRHVKTVHNKIKDYECTVCGHKFIINSNLIKHIKVHEKDKKIIEELTEKLSQSEINNKSAKEYIDKLKLDYENLLKEMRSFSEDNID